MDKHKSNISGLALLTQDQCQHSDWSRQGHLVGTCFFVRDMHSELIEMINSDAHLGPEMEAALEIIQSCPTCRASLESQLLEQHRGQEMTGMALLIEEQLQWSSWVQRGHISAECFFVNHLTDEIKDAWQSQGPLDAELEYAQDVFKGCPKCARELGIDFVPAIGGNDKPPQPLPESSRLVQKVAAGGALGRAWIYLLVAVICFGLGAAGYAFFGKSGKPPREYRLVAGKKLTLSPGEAVVTKNARCVALRESKVVAYNSSNEFHLRSGTMDCSAVPNKGQMRILYDNTSSKNTATRYIVYTAFWVERGHKVRRTTLLVFEGTVEVSTLNRGKSSHLLAKVDVGESAYWYTVSKLTNGVVSSDGCTVLVTSGDRVHVSSRSRCDALLNLKMNNSAPRKILSRARCLAAYPPESLKCPYSAKPKPSDGMKHGMRPVMGRPVRRPVMGRPERRPVMRKAEDVIWE